MEECDTVIYI